MQKGLRKTTRHKKNRIGMVCKENYIEKENDKCKNTNYKNIRFTE